VVVLLLQAIDLHDVSGKASRQEQWNWYQLTMKWLEMSRLPEVQQQVLRLALL
jgi:hypothetical protein